MCVKKTTEQFIKEASIKHGNKFDYSKTIYVGKGIKVIITCPTHGDFEQTPNGHLRGSGCVKCYESSRHDQNSFIIKANEIYDNYYDYSEVVYKNALTKIDIICPIHGKFSQRASSHLYGMGCIACAASKAHPNKTDKEKFIKKAKIKHGEKYDYSKVDKYLTRDRNIIICPMHGEFIQKVNDHINLGKGCKQCAINSRTNIQDDVLSNFRKVHLDTYDYSKVVYIHSKKHVDIICRIHGIFSQTPKQHLRGNGCNYCAIEHGTYYVNGIRWKNRAVNSGHFESFKFYIYRVFNETEEFYKFGITYRKIGKRFNNSNMPYSMELITYLEDEYDADKIFNFEIKAKRIVHNKKYNPKLYFEGETECFDISVSIPDLIQQLL